MVSNLNNQVSFCNLINLHNFLCFPAGIPVSSGHSGGHSGLGGSHSGLGGGHSGLGGGHSALSGLSGFTGLGGHGSLTSGEDSGSNSFGSSHSKYEESDYHQAKPHHHGGHGHHQVGHSHNSNYQLKRVLVPLAGIALLGAAAALATNPVLLQLGVVSGNIFNVNF